MSTVVTAPPTRYEPSRSPTVPRPPRRSSGFATLSRRRFSLSADTPREIVVPLLTPILFASVIAPALAKAMTRAARSTT